MKLVDKDLQDLKAQLDQKQETLNEMEEEYSGMWQEIEYLEKRSSANARIIELQELSMSVEDAMDSIRVDIKQLEEEIKEMEEQDVAQGS
jgi:chromosome segregation ATPase